MRVTHVLAEKGFSAGERQLEWIARYLHDRGHENSFVLMPGAEFGRVAEDLGAPIFEAPLRRPLKLGGMLALRRHFRDSRPDVVHFACGKSLMWGGLAALGLPIPLRITIRRIDYPIGRAPWKAVRYRRLVDHTIAICENIRQRVLSAGVDPSRVHIVLDGIEVDRWLDVALERDAARERLGFRSDDVVIACAGTLARRKGQDVLIDALAQLGDRRAQVILGGVGPEREAYAAQAESLGVRDQLHLPGYVDPVTDLYAAADVKCMPSRHEGLSNAAVEAAVVGLPLVTSDVGGFPEIVEQGVNGTRVPPGDAAALAAALRPYVEDADLRRVHGAAGRGRALRMFRHDRMLAELEELFVSLQTPR